MALKENYFSVKNRISEAAKKSMRSPESIKLVVVTKERTAEEIRQVMELGQRHFGENRTQELEEKAQQFPQADWHFIGHLQSNKAKTAVEFSSSIHSVDSLKLLRKINDSAREIDKTQEVLLEVNVSKEPTKHGFFEEAIPSLLDTIKQLPFGNVRILGLMTMAPLVEKEKTRPVFRRLFGLGQELHLKELSMGMSNDFEVAVEEGATIVRVGSAVFGGRN